MPSKVCLIRESHKEKAEPEFFPTELVTIKDIDANQELLWYYGDKYEMQQDKAISTNQDGVAYSKDEEDSSDDDFSSSSEASSDFAPAWGSALGSALGSNLEEMTGLSGMERAKSPTLGDAWDTSAMFHRFDSNGDRLLSINEFSHLFTDGLEGRPQDVFLWYDYLNVNKDGGVDPEELQAINE